MSSLLDKYDTDDKKGIDPFFKFIVIMIGTVAGGLGLLSLLI